MILITEIKLLLYRFSRYNPIGRALWKLLSFGVSVHFDKEDEKHWNEMEFKGW